jgi:hypothetical protein
VEGGEEMEKFGSASYLNLFRALSRELFSPDFWKSKEVYNVVKTDIMPENDNKKGGLELKSLFPANSKQD